jgi:hypothetical protein
VATASVVSWHLLTVLPVSSIPHVLAAVVALAALLVVVGLQLVLDAGLQLQAGRVWHHAAALRCLIMAFFFGGITAHVP